MSSIALVSSDRHAAEVEAAALEPASGRLLVDELRDGHDAVAALPLWVTDAADWPLYKLCG